MECIRVIYCILEDFIHHGKSQTVSADRKTTLYPAIQTEPDKKNANCHVRVFIIIVSNHMSR